MHTRIATLLTTLTLGLASVLTAGALPQTASAVVDNTPDCDNVAIIKCGAFSADSMRAKASQGDVPRVFSAMGISQDDLKGGYADGIVWRDGRVTVDGKVVATGAMTAGRNFGGTPIPNTDGAGKYPTSKFATEGQTAFVKMVGGKFSFAVIKTCGNPVSATPTTPSQPPVNPAYECVSLTAEKISQTKVKFTAKATATGGATIEAYEFGFGDGMGVTSPVATYDYEYKKTGTFHTNVVVHVKVNGQTKKVTSKACEKDVTIGSKTTTPPQALITVCELSTNKLIHIKENEFDSTKHSKNLNDCKTSVAPSMIEVCEIETKNTITIEEKNFDASKHTKDFNQCAKVLSATTETPAPEQIASTGPEAIASGLFGSGVLGYGGFSYFRSRRNLLRKFLNR